MELGKKLPERTRLVRLHQLAASAITTFLCLAAPADERMDTTRDPSCCNVLELRQYTLYPGHRDGFIDLFDSTFADPLDATGMTVIGQFRDLDRPDRFVWLRGFQNMEARPKELAAFYDGELWHRHRDQANSSIDDSDNVLLLQPALPTLRFKSVLQRPSGLKNSGVHTSGLIVATLFYARPDSLSAFGEFFRGHLRARVEAAGAQSLAEYVTSAEPNNFPRLPIRTGEHIYVWIAQFHDPAAYAAYEARLKSDKNWGQLWPAAREKLARDPEVLRLSPTPRSRLQG